MSNLDFKGKNIYIGIDVHKRSWHVQLLSDHTTLQDVHFRDATPQILSDYLSKRYPNATYLCAYEAGFCGFWIYEQLNDLGIKTIVIHPADIPTTDKEKQFKTDRKDAIKIALSLRANQLRGIYVPPKTQRADRSFLRMRYKLARDIRRSMNRITGHLDFEGEIVIDPQKVDKPFDRWSNRRISILEEKAKKDNDYTLTFYLIELRRQRNQMLEIIRHIRSISQCDRYKHMYDILTSVPGVGCLTAMVWITEIGDINRFKHEDHLYSYLGLIPGTRSSGDTPRVGKMTRRGNKILRTALVQSAWVAVRLEPRMTLAYENYRPRMGAQKAIIRVTKKLAALLRSMMKNKTLYAA